MTTPMMKGNLMADELMLKVIMMSWAFGCLPTLVLERGMND